MLAEMLAAGMNSNVPGFDQGAAVVERQVIRWLAELLGFAPTASGLLVSGASSANLVGLTVARNAKAGFDVRARGLQGGESPKLLVYASTETHSWVAKSCELLGLGRIALRYVPVNSRFEMETDALRSMLAKDRAAGHRPVCVVGNAGTVNTGATDDLRALRSICRREDVWFHVDGAFGALAAFAPELKPLVAGMEQADSLAFDLHKWGYVPYEAGCVLVRDESAHRAAFSTPAAYQRSATRGVAIDPLYFADLGVQLSRSFRALKVWMSLKTQGARAWGRLIRQNVNQARYLAALVEKHADLELLAPVPLNVVCFRYRHPGLDEHALNRLNETVLVELQERGIAVPSGTTLGGRFALRVANTNQRSRQEDFDALVEGVRKIGGELAAAATKR
jgi:glutamate/tyrosine decarboxylase-like PLP-dependent enzyme